MALIDIQPLSDRKREILNSARGLFSRKGFLAATMRDLAKELNIQPPSLYSHYDSKDEILWEIALRCANQFYEEVLPIAEEEASIADRMDRMIRQHASVILANQDAAAIFLLEWEHLAEPRRSKFAEITHYYQQAFVKTHQRRHRSRSLSSCETQIYHLHAPGQHRLDPPLVSPRWRSDGRTNRKPTL
jgi:AcrR family transcriptional regulator